MHPLTNEIIASREWRMRELEDLKKVGILALNTYPQKVKNQYYRMCIPYIYAHWEGFIVESFKQLISFLNDSTVSVAPIYWVMMGMGVAVNEAVKKQHIQDLALAVRSSAGSESEGRAVNGTPAAAQSRTAKRKKGAKR